MIEHIRKWFRTYVIGTLTVFPAVWMAMPMLQTLLPPDVVSTCACIAGAVLLYKELAAKRAEAAAAQKP